MPFGDGDIIEFDYELWVEGHEGLYDTTLREAAEAAGTLEPGAHYAPIPYPVGSGRIVPGLERALRAAELGRAVEVELAPEDAYGARDAKLVETIPMAKFKRNDVTPAVGLPITYENRRGVVVTVGGGRVRVDFNPALAGKHLKYRFTVRRHARTVAEKVESLLRMHVPGPVEWKAEVAKVDGRATATVEVPDAVVTRRDWLVAKLRALMDIRRFAGVERVRLVETYSLVPATASGASGGGPALNALEEPPPPAEGA